MAILIHSQILNATYPDGQPVPYARLHVYWAGSEQLCPLYTNSALTYSVANPLVSNAFGVFPLFHVSEGSFRVRIEDRYGRIVADIDNLEAQAQHVAPSTPEFTAVQALVEDTTLVYTADPGIKTMAPGTIIEIGEMRFRYRVLAEEDTSYHLQTTGGLKLRCEPNERGEIFASQLNWKEGQDITDALLRLFERLGDDIQVLRIDGTFHVRGSGHEIPPGLRAILSDDYETLTHGSRATRGLAMMDATDESANHFGLPRDLNAVFKTPPGFIVGGLRFTHAAPVTTELLPNGGNKGALWTCSNNAEGITVDKCRFDFAGGVGVRIGRSPYWRFTNNHAGQQKMLLELIGCSDFGLFQGNKGRMGYRALNLNGSREQIFGDFIKTMPFENKGPRYCRVIGNHFLSDTRDGPDGTGGFHGWTFSENVFEVAVAGIDIKQTFREPSALLRYEANYWGLVIRDNTFIGCGIVYTSLWDAQNMGAAFDNDRTIRGVLCLGNRYLPKIGKNTVAHHVKSTNAITSVGEIMQSVETRYAGDWDPNSGSFPANSVLGTHYVVAADGTIDGESFSSGDFLRPRVDGADTATFKGSWAKDTDSWARIGVIPLKLGDEGSYALVDAGPWDPATGVFPSGSLPGNYFRVVAAGSVAGVAFEQGDYLVPKVANASTSQYEGQWIKRTQSPGVIPRNLRFKNLRWDSRGAQATAISPAEDVSIHFDEWIADGTGQLLIGGRDIKISGRARSENTPPGVMGTVDLIRLQGARDVQIELDYVHGSQEAQGALCCVTQEARNVWIDGRYAGSRQLVDVASNGVLDGLHLGRRTRLSLGHGMTMVLRTRGATSNVLCGDVDWNGYQLFNEEPANHNLGALQRGLGPVVAAASGAIMVTHEVHRITAHGVAADLNTISGGAAGDRLMAMPAATGEQLTIRSGTGNIALPADVILDNPADTLCLEKRGDGQWHQVALTQA